jgi:hypothetical protein
VAAARTQQKRRISAPIEQQDGLLTGGQGRAQRGQKRRGQKGLVGGFDMLFQIDDFDLRQKSARRSLLQNQPREFALFGQFERFQRRRGRPKHRDRSGLSGPPQRDIPTVVVNAVVLFERGVVFLIDDEDAQVFQRREHRRTGPERDGGVASQNPMPCAGPFRRRQRRMEHRNLARKTRRKTRKYTSVFPEPVTPCSKKPL